MGGQPGLGQLLLMIAAARRQAILGRRTRQEELAERNTEREFRQQQLQYQMDRAKTEAEAAKTKATEDARIKRLGQSRAAYMPLLQMGRTQDEIAALSQTPGALEALRRDQADILQGIASGDENFWEGFQPRYYGGRGYVPQPPTAAPTMPGEPQRGMFGAPMLPPPERTGVMGSMQLPPSLPQPTPVAPVAAAPPAIPAPVAAWLMGQQPSAPKTAATIADLGAGTAEKKARTKRTTLLSPLEANLLRERVLGQKATTGLTTAKTGTEKGEAGRRERTTRVAEKGVEIKGKTQAATEKYQTGTLEERREARKSKERQAEASLQLKRDMYSRGVGTKGNPQENATYKKLVDIFTKRRTNPMTGRDMGPFHSNEERVNAWEGMKGHARKRGGSLAGFTPPPGGAPWEETPKAATAPGGGGFSEAQINAVARALDEGTYKTMLQQSSPEVRRQAESARQEVMRRRKAKGKR